MMLTVDGLTHRYDDELAIDDVSFGVEEGELVALLGPSGCGKTTVVQAVAGHVRPTAGTIGLRGEDVTGRPPETRSVSVVFQRSTLYPHMTVGENVAYGLKAGEFDAARRAALIEEYLDLVSLGAQRSAYPSELSGGQRRRAELARALAPQPDVLLLDEPLSALDRRLRGELRDEIARIQRETGVTTLFVTHDQDDAMALADRIAVMRDGSIAASGRPRTLYESPPNPFVAAFLGRSNALPGSVVATDPPEVRVAAQSVVLPGQQTDIQENASVTCHLRPEHLSLSAGESDGSTPSLSGEITHVRDVGRRFDVTTRVGPDAELLIEQAADPPAVGETVTVTFRAADLTLFRGAGPGGEA
jgi:ABC-type Fe3+/spermidine/putrescine transport system ATPase subunit